MKALVIGRPHAISQRRTAISFRISVLNSTVAVGSFG
jgi:hypothetical protein